MYPVTNNCNQEASKLLLTLSEGGGGPSEEDQGSLGSILALAAFTSSKRTSDFPEY
ncbi:hypothetical protein Hanom_Chr02g00109801 [Helianthus anomalus]